MRPCVPRIISTAPNSPSPTRARRRHQQVGQRQGAARGGAGAAQHDPGYMFSRIQWLRRSDKIAEAARWLIAAPHDPAKLIDRRSMVDRTAADRAQTARSRRRQIGLSGRRRRRGAEQRELPRRTAVHRRLDRAAISARAGRRAPPLRPHRRRRHQSDHAGALVLLAGPRRRGRSGASSEARAYYEAAARYPTAYYGQLARAQLGLDEFDAAPDAGSAAAELRALEIARAFEILYAVDERDIVASMAADLGDKSTDAAALATLGRDRDAPQRRARHAAHRQDRAWPRLAVRALRVSGLRRAELTSRSARRSSAAWSTRSCARRARSIRRVVSSANALGLMQVTPAAGRDTARKFKVAVRSAPPDG